MKTDNTLLALLLATAVAARPGGGWHGKLAEIQQKAAEFDKRAASPIRGPQDSDEMIGDLATPGPQTAIGHLVADILKGVGDPQSTEKYSYPVPALGTDACKQDTCCVWKYIADEMLVQFRGDSIRCNRYARGAVRLGFHDAGAWKKGLDFGGADGGILLTDEITRKENKGLEEIAAVTKAWYEKYKGYGVGMADLIQMGANVATVACPLGPRTRTFIGRKDIAQASTPGLLPDANDSADVLINLFLDKTIKPHGLAALIGAHSTSQQRFFKPERALDPQDTTPGVWDVAYYSETLDPNAPGRVLKFPSDINLANDPRVADQFKGFADPKLGQQHWNDDYAKEYIRLSLLGVQNINFLTDCTKVLPDAILTFNAPDAENINQWVHGGYGQYGVQVGQLLENGQSTVNASLQAAGISPAAAWEGFNKPVPGAQGGAPGQTEQPKFLGGLTGTLASTLPPAMAGLGNVGSGAGAAVGGAAGGLVGGLAGGLFGGAKPSGAPAAAPAAAPPAAAASQAPKNIPAIAAGGWSPGAGAKPSEAPAAAAAAAAAPAAAASPPAGNPAANFGSGAGGWQGGKPNGAPAAAPAPAASSPAAAPEAAKPSAAPAAAASPKEGGGGSGMPNFGGGAGGNFGGGKPSGDAPKASSAPAAEAPKGGSSGTGGAQGFQGGQGAAGGRPGGNAGQGFGKPGRR